MPALNGNNWYVALDGVDVSGFITEVSMDPKNSTVDTTAGSGRTHMQRQPGLDDTTGKITVSYFVGEVSTYITKLQRGKVVNLVSGPEGAVSGKPKHQQDIIINQISGPKQTVSKEHVVFEVSWEAADAPQVDMYDGGVFA